LSIIKRQQYEKNIKHNSHPSCCSKQFVSAQDKCKYPCQGIQRTYVPLTNGTVSRWKRHQGHCENCTHLRREINNGYKNLYNQEMADQIFSYPWQITVKGLSMTDREKQVYPGFRFLGKIQTMACVEISCSVRATSSDATENWGLQMQAFRSLGSL
jgi:hypothetical protein